MRTSELTGVPFCARFSQLNRVDTFCCFTYTFSVVLRPLGLVKGKSSRPGTMNDGTGMEERPKWGASPAKPCEPLRCNEMQFTPWGEASARSTGFADLSGTWG